MANVSVPGLPAPRMAARNSAVASAQRAARSAPAASAVAGEGASLAWGCAGDLIRTPGRLRVAGRRAPPTPARVGSRSIAVRLRPHAVQNALPPGGSPQNGQTRSPGRAAQRRRPRSSGGRVLGPTCSSSHALSGAAARQACATCPSAASRSMPPAAGQAGARDDRLAPQQLDPGMVARVAARRGAQRLAGDLEAVALRRGRRLREPGAARVFGHRGAEALELVARHPVVAGARVEPRRGDLRVEARPRARRALEHAVGARLVRRLVR